MDLKKLMNGSSPQSIMLEQTRGLKSKWQRTGLLEGVGSETAKHGMAVMLENQAKQLIDEATKTGASAGSEEWAGVALPLVRRIFGSIAAKEFVSVQPMNLPSGLIFYMDFKYSSAQPGNPDFSGSSMFGNGGTVGKDSLSPAGNKLGSTQVAEGGLYGAGRFGYSINDVTASLGTGSVTFATASWADVDFSNALSASIAVGDIKKATIAAASLSEPDYNGVRAFEITSGSVNGITQYSQYTNINGTNIELFVKDINKASLAGDSVTVWYHKQPTATSRGDFEDRTGADVGIPEIELELKSEPIVAKTRKLKAIWTPELAQDLNA
jgi:hypothetical protein